MLFIAPQVVNAAVGGSILLASLFSEMGYNVTPKAREKRSDIIQVIELETRTRLEKFAQAIQSAPVDSLVTPNFTNAWL